MAFPVLNFISTKLVIFLYFLNFFIFVLPMTSSQSKLRGNETDSISLLEFKKMIKGDPFGVMASWNETIHFCEWFGVSCSRRHQRVTSINLKSLKLVGSVPSHIGNMSFLIVLDLQNNSFSGEIPLEIKNLHRMQILHLNNNFLSGVIPSNISACKKLKHVNFSYNNLTGNIPSELGTLTNLRRVDFSQNNLIGKIPHCLRNLSLLYFISLTFNNLLGEIPDSLCRLPRLQYFVVSQNSLIGTIPPSLFNHSSMLVIDAGENHIGGTLHPNLSVNLPRLFFFAIFENNFTGSIPVTLSNATQMQMFGVSVNKLTGKVPTDLGKLQKLQYFYAGDNHLGEGNIIDLNFLCSLTNVTSLEVLELGLNNFGGFFGLTPLVLGIVGLTLVAFILCFGWLRSQRKGSFPDMLENSTLRMSYHSLLKSTNGFSEENLLGVGGFGAVYKGYFNHDRIVFAVKVLDLLQHGAFRSFVAECEVLKNTKHRNLVKVLTACSGFDFRGNDFKAIVYEYMDNGNLENWLHFSPQENSQIEDNRRLSFVQRLNILIDVACTLDYLHNDCEPSISHCDLKPSNVLLCENMIAHVSDFGLSRFVQQKIQSSSKNHSSNRVRGTVGYAPPEYGMGSKASKAGDVYSFGIIILEMLTGRRPTDELFKDGLNLHTYAKAGLADRGMEIVDPKLLQEIDEQTQMRKKGKSCEKNDKFHVCLVSMFKVGVACSVESPVDRMNIHDVVGELNKSRKTFLM